MLNMESFLGGTGGGGLPRGGICGGSGALWVKNTSLLVESLLRFLGGSGGGCKLIGLSWTNGDGMLCELGA